MILHQRTEVCNSGFQVQLAQLEVRHRLTTRIFYNLEMNNIIMYRLLRFLTQKHTSALMESIDELPNDLEELYNFMFAKMTDSDKCEGSRYMQILVYTRQVQKTFPGHRKNWKRLFTARYVFPKEPVKQFLRKFNTTQWHNFDNNVMKQQQQPPWYDKILNI